VPFSAISLYLKTIHVEASARGYFFGETKIKPTRKSAILTVTSGQVACEWGHLLAKLKQRNLALYHR
jgi:hypothetical protein